MEEGNFSFWVAVAFTCNYIVGTGFLTLPYAFHSAGVGLSFIVLLFMGGMSVMSVDLILECSARATALGTVRGQEEGGGGDTGGGSGGMSAGTGKRPDAAIGTSLERSSGATRGAKYTAISGTDEGEEGDGGGLEMVNKAGGDGTTLGHDDSSAVYNPISGHGADRGANAHGSATTRGSETRGSSAPLEVKHQKFELTELCELFMGTSFKNLYTAVICVYMYGTLWVFSAVFGKALAYHLTLGGNEEWSYAFYLFLFACLVVPTSCMELREQVYMQCILAGLRIVMMVLMLGTVLPSLLDSDLRRPFLEDDGTVQGDGGGAAGFHLGNIHHIITIGAYAFIFHHSVPSLAQPVKDKTTLNSIFSTTISFCLLGYTLLGVILATFFGDNLEQSANLNWSNYVGHSGNTLEPTFISECVAAFIVLFPALDVASAFPLNAITLGNSIMTASYGSMNEYREACNDRVKVSCYRVLAAAPPIMGAAVLKDLGSLTAWTGMSGLLIVFLFPPVLCLASATELKARGISPTTIYGTRFTTDNWIYFTLTLGGILSVYCSYCLVAHPPTEGEGEG